MPSGGVPSGRDVPQYEHYSVTSGHYQRLIRAPSSPKQTRAQSGPNLTLRNIYAAERANKLSIIRYGGPYCPALPYSRMKINRSDSATTAKNTKETEFHRVQSNGRDSR